MKKYYLYVQEPKKQFTKEVIIVEQDKRIKSNRYYYRYSPFYCIGYVEGKQEAYQLTRQLLLYHSLTDYNHGLICFHYEAERTIRYVVTDTKGKVLSNRDLYCKKKENHNSKTPHQWNHVSIKDDLKNELSPLEKEVLMREYHIYFRGIKNNNSYYYCKYCDTDYKKISKSWKDQSKRERQYKVR